MNFLKDLDRKLAGLPDKSLSITLILAGIIAIIVALYGTPTMKAAVLTWMVAP